MMKLAYENDARYAYTSHASHARYAHTRYARYTRYTRYTRHAHIVRNFASNAFFACKVKQTLL